MDSIEKLLSAHFPQLEPELIAEMSEKGDFREIKEGEPFIHSGQNIRSAILVIEGLVKIYREDDEGHEFFMYYLDPGKACALTLLCSLRQETSAVMAKAEINSTLLFIPLQSVDSWMRKYSSWNQFALGSYRERFEELLQTIDHIAFRNMDARLVFYLKRQQEKMGTDSIPFSFTQVAQDLNSSREVISRLMKKLSENGLIRYTRNMVEVIDLNRNLV
ncbi:MAG: Crp/Fnr family transcriptional regulator [Ferruginibacter sp.]|nr:Crp/Fnr family transcriptional regulator [Bacteroidota bacterium]MCW5916395.1 Crp/Fnr family transcriptional regulator [Ferruginibacter sp.]